MADFFAIYVSSTEDASKLYDVLRRAVLKSSGGELISALDKIDVIYNPNAVVKRKTRNSK